MKVWTPKDVNEHFTSITYKNRMVLNKKKKRKKSQKGTHNPLVHQIATNKNQEATKKFTTSQEQYLFIYFDLNFFISIYFDLN